ncbi:MAG TPA: type 4a pilus biogenesis protein PilO [Rhodocyclaceae bacterium]|jgi:type IV pilus assembly protein PilO|nr:type 4a pilus biogenesis protein PilO [Rhodocyclaceae bacterium]
MNAKLNPPKVAIPKIDFQQLATDFRTLDPKDPGLWPLAPRIVILAGLFALLVVAAWWFGWSPQMETLAQSQQKETELRDEWVSKKRQAVNLEAHRRQLAEINRTFGALLKQLPNASEVEKLLVDINQAGVGQGLQFDLFQPLPEVRKDFYAELPIKIRLFGTYHELGAFAGDIAKLSRIVTLNDIDLTVSKDSTLTLNTVAKTFRYLDEQEIAQQRKGGAKK